MSLNFETFAAWSDEACIDRIHQLKQHLGEKLFILGHYYQRDEVFQCADVSGDSLQLSFAASKTQAPYVVFCGVHFMAEVADMLTRPDQVVMLPDQAAGCSMADMANVRSVNQCWEDLRDLLGADPDASICPITYINSSAALKAFCGVHGGTLCTSSNAQEILNWALQQDKKVLFFPDQHLGRNTAYAMGIPLAEMVVYDFNQPMGGLTPDDLQRARVILWSGYCSVHQKFQPEHIEAYLAKHPEARIIAHPEAPFEVCQRSDHVGSTSYILKTIEASPEGTRWLVATELNLVNRLKHMFKKDHKIVDFMAPTVSMCSTMFRTDPQHLVWVLENIAQGHVVNRITVPERVSKPALIALDRMFAITQPTT